MTRPSIAVILQMPPTFANRSDDNPAAFLPLADLILLGEMLEEHLASHKSPVSLIISGLRGMWFKMC